MKPKMTIRELDLSITRPDGRGVSVAGPCRGPWRVSTPDEGGSVIVRGPDGEIVATVSRQRNVIGCATNGPETAEANARLVAASPDLLWALEFVQKYFGMKAEKGDPVPSQLSNAVGKALAKARGEREL